MKVLMTATSFPRGPGDWRGRFIYDMAAALGEVSDVQLSLWAPPGALPPGVAGAASPEEAAWLSSLADAGGIAHLLRTAPWLGAAKAWQLLRRQGSACRRSQPDIFHINWLQNLLALGAAPQPALVTVLGSDLSLLRLPGMVSLIRRALHRRPTLVAPNSSWMKPILQSHFGDLAEIIPIPFGIHPRWSFLRRDDKPDSHGVWLVVARITQKKLGHLLSWGEAAFSSRSRRLILLGPMQENISLPPWVEWKGATNPEELAHRWFPQATGLLTLSCHDEGLPQVMLEALASGLPIVASDLGAHRELLDGRPFGRIVLADADLISALNHFEDASTNRTAGQAAQEWVRDNVGTWTDCAARYLNAYQQLLAKTPQCR